MRSNRLTEMEQYIRNNETVSLEALCDEFNISMNTVRRDVALLVERGNVEKILGGVRSTSLQPASFQMRTRYLFAQKQRIGYAAAALVNDRDVIYIGPGNTTIQIISGLADKKNITIITNNLAVMEIVSVMDNIDLIALPGKLLHGNLSFNDPEQVAYFNRYNVRTAFMPTAGISLECGISYGSLEEAEFSRHVISRCQKRVVLADHTKFGVVGLVTMADFSSIDVIVTDEEPSPAYRKALEKVNVQLIVADHGHGHS